LHGGQVAEVKKMTAHDLDAEESSVSSSVKLFTTRTLFCGGFCGG
jgi:hypothetical protein